MAAAEPREDVISSAVRFLSDPKVQSASLAKQVSFLETKGLTSVEIEDALKRAKLEVPQGLNSVQNQSNINQTGALVSAPKVALSQYQSYPTPPPRPRYDWKDFFIAAVVAGGLGYGLYELTVNFLIPYFTQSSRKLQESQEQFNSNLEKTDKSLTRISESISKTLTAVEASNEQVNSALTRIEKLFERLLDENLKNSNSLDERLSDLAKSVAKSATNDKKPSSSISDLQSELRSIKALILSRRVPPSTTSTPVTAPAVAATSTTATTPTVAATPPQPDVSPSNSTTFDSTSLISNNTGDASNESLALPIPADPSSAYLSKSMDTLSPDVPIEDSVSPKDPSPSSSRVSDFFKTSTDQTTDSSLPSSSTPSIPSWQLEQS
ncbi:Peroxisomal membrane protein PER10 [Smittium mucronatum]|uniref:Peroxisomal membrane protein PEX14 n=1 Tax=Smittium mucronatum TaxID=133383 RepID=A0A1R0H3K8_9FUNG|nr:Peroxisomal membrane protein PER10 [Smittium mucronatum]